MASPRIVPTGVLGGQKGDKGDRGVVGPSGGPFPDLTGVTSGKVPQTTGGGGVEFVDLSASFVQSKLPKISGRANGLKFDGTDETATLNALLATVATFGGGELALEGLVRCDGQVKQPAVAVSGTAGRVRRQASPLRVTGTVQNMLGFEITLEQTPYPEMGGLDLRYAGRTDTGCTTTLGSNWIANPAAVEADRGHIVKPTPGGAIPDQCWILAVDVGAGWVVSNTARASGSTSVTSYSGRIEALGDGTLDFDRIQFTNNGAPSSAPFGLTTSPRARITECLFLGHSSKGGPASDEDPWVFGGPGQGTMLTAGLTQGQTYTTLVVKALPTAIQVGGIVTLNVGTNHAQQVTLVGGAAAGATTLNVQSFTATSAHPARSSVYIGNYVNETSEFAYSVPSAPFQGYASRITGSQFYRCRRIVFGGFATSCHVDQNAWMHDCGSNLAAAPSTLTTGLTKGQTYTSVAVSALSRNVIAGDTIQVGVGFASQELTAASPAAQGATSVTVTSFVAAYTFATGVKVFNATAGLGAMVESYAIEEAANSISVSDNRMGFSGGYNYATRFEGTTIQSLVSGNDFQDVSAGVLGAIAGHRFGLGAHSNTVIAALAPGLPLIDDRSDHGAQRQTVIPHENDVPAQFPGGVYSGNKLVTLLGATFNFEDTVGGVHGYIAGNHQWFFGGNINVVGNPALPVGSSSIEVGDDGATVDDDAVFRLRPSAGKSALMQVPGWLFYDAASTLWFMRDRVNSRMHVTYVPGATAALADSQFNSNISVEGAIRAKSPDGTLYKLVPPNGGGAATWTPA